MQARSRCLEVVGCEEIHKGRARFEIKKAHGKGTTLLHSAGLPTAGL